jgi:hypothetical protein
LSNNILPPTTAGIKPEQFADNFSFTRNRRILIPALILIALAGLFLRANGLGTESLGEDEFNKLQTVAEYRENGLSGRNGEHPFLMKGLQTVSIIAAEKWNASVAGDPSYRISEEAALRFPTIVFGALTAVVLFFLVAELFGPSIGLIAAALWAVDPTVIGFNRIAKEDSFFIFFFILANIFLLKSQSIAEREEGDHYRPFWMAAVAFGGMMASKYYPHFLSVGAAYFNTFLAIPSTRWHIRKTHWLYFFILMGAAFVCFNPTILLPSTWHEMLTFSSEKRIGHDAYEYLGELYRNQLTTWLYGVPWTFYLVFVWVKTPLVTLVFFLIGLPVYLLRKLGDGRYFLLYWFALGVFSFSVLGGKFTRYFTLAEPLVIITAAIGFYFTLRFLSDRLGGYLQSQAALFAFQAVFFGLFLFSSVWISLRAAPYFRLETNWLGGGTTKAGTYFPHDEFYDMSTREISENVAGITHSGAQVANETPALFAHYLKKAGRDDLHSVSLSDRSKMQNFRAGDVVVLAEGRRYFSNDRYVQYLKGTSPTAEIKIGEITSARIYKLDETMAEKIRELAGS